MTTKHFRYVPVLLAIVGCALTLPACKKENPVTIIRGRITEFGTNLPVKGARIYLLCYDGAIFGGNFSTLSDSIVTDTNGEFYQEYPQEDVCGGSYMIVYKEGYFKRDGIGVTTGTNNVVISLDPEAWLKVVTIPDGTDHFDHIGIGGDFSFEASSYQSIKEVFFMAHGNRNITVRWGPFSNPSLKFSSTFFIPGHDTTTYIIHY